MGNNRAIDKRKLPGYLQGYQEGFRKGQEMGLEIARQVVEHQIDTRMIIVGEEKKRLQKFTSVIIGIEGLEEGDEDG